MTHADFHVEGDEDACGASIVCEVPRGSKIACLDFSNAGMLNEQIGPDGPQALRCVRGPVLE